MPLYNEFLYNTGLYNGGPQARETYSTDLVVFEGLSLSDNVNVICQHLGDSAPSRTLIEGDVPRGDGKFLIGDYWREKVITVGGIVQHDSATELDDYLDTIRKTLRVPSGNLDITRHGVGRRYLATLINPEELFGEREGHHITFCPFTAAFKCNVPFASDREYTSSLKSLTTSPDSDTIANTGTVEALPVFLLVVNSANSVTDLRIKNDQTGEEIRYTGSVAAGDVFIFDSEAMTVTRNGVAVDYSGSFPVLDVGSNVIRYTVTGASFSIGATTKWKRRYL